MSEVQAHQKQLEKVRENYTYTSLQTTQDIDSNGQVKKTETEENEDFFVNGHVIERTVKKNGKPLDGHDEQKETERVTKLVEKAEKTPPDQPLEGQTISVSRLLEIMDVRNAAARGVSRAADDRVRFHRPQGREDAGLAEDASKKLQGTIWIDEADRQVAHLEVSFNDKFHVVGGLLANIQKGSNFRFDQAPVNRPARRIAAGLRRRGLWLPTGRSDCAGAGAAGEESAPAFCRARLRLQAVQRGDAAGKDAKVAPGKAE